MNILLDQAEKWLKELGISTIRIDGGDLAVSRKDMVNLLGSDEDKTYGEILKELKSGCYSNKFCWMGKDDDYLYLGCF